MRDPQAHKEEFWHTYIDYEICLHVSANPTCLQAPLFVKNLNDQTSHFGDGYVWLPACKFFPQMSISCLYACNDTLVYIYIPIFAIF